MDNKVIKKPFLTYEEQINKLVTKKLVIDDKECALELLKENSYFDIICGYKKPFKRKNGDYKLHTSINDIYELYRFDDKLRALFLKYLLKIEKHIKSLTSYSFCIEYGEDQNQYMNSNNYNYTSKNMEDINKLVLKLEKLAKNTDQYSYINHQREKHGNVPLWVLMKALSFGKVSKMYSLLPQKIQQRISKEFDGINEKMLERILDMLTRVRNVCAHNERLFDFRYETGGIKETELHKKIGIKKRYGEYVKGKNDLFAVIIVFKYMLKENDYKQFTKLLGNMMNRLLDKTSIIQKKQLYKYMGLPENWTEL